MILGAGSSGGAFGGGARVTPPSPPAPFLDPEREATVAAMRLPSRDRGRVPTRETAHHGGRRGAQGQGRGRGQGQGREVQGQGAPLSLRVRALNGGTGDRGQGRAAGAPRAPLSPQC
ncbi:hypothetical protein COCON_G00219890 [Conger conger]|uniref:Uncharacterized protein n=1 Tax=Conger conger TaxID=82655 RepID=A0A9Q1HMU2_CONCO|nr:hypothetical protein COCON_G00219890 [Conger conger]